MGRFVAHRNLTIGDGSEKGENGKHLHKPVKKGEVFETSDEYAEEHLNPLEKDDDDFNPSVNFCSPTTEPVTVQAKIEAKKKVKAEKLTAKEKAKAAKAAVAADPKGK